MKVSEKIQIWISASAVILSVFAIVISIYANSISQNAYRLSLDIFNAERRIAVRSEKEKTHLRLSPLEEGQQIHSISIYFPSELKIEPLTLTPPDLNIYYAIINSNIQNHREQQIPAKQGYALVLLNHPIPALFLIHGYSKGYASQSAGIYDLIYSVSRDETQAHIELRTAVLNNFHKEVSDPQQLIDSIYQDLKREFSKNNNLAKKPKIICTQEQHITDAYCRKFERFNGCHKKAH